MRAEDLIDRTGLRIGLFAGLAGQHIQSASIREEADRMDQPKMVQAEKPSQPAVTPTEASGRLATAKGEEPVDRIAECSGHFAALAGLPIQKAPAHLHEAGEDLWLEAQNDRNEKENGRETQ